MATTALFASCVAIEIVEVDPEPLEVAVRPIDKTPEYSKTDASMTQGLEGTCIVTAVELPMLVAVQIYI